jgi:hypothetical protein
MENGTVLVNGVTSPAERDADGTIYSSPEISRRAASVYPEHDKLQAVKEASQSIGEFLTWLQDEQGVVLTKVHAHSDFCYEDGDRMCGVEKGALVPVLASVPSWLSRYFDIDEAKLEAEKRQMLDECRSWASTG